MKIKRIRKSAADLSFDLISTIIMIFVLLVTLYPFWYVLVGSFSSVGHLIKGGFVLWPDGIHLDAYAQVFRNDMIPTAYRNTLIITIGGTLLSMFLTILGCLCAFVEKPARAQVHHDVLRLYHAFQRRSGSYVSGGQRTGAD